MIAEERPRLSLSQSFSKLFKDLGLSPRAVSTAFGSRVNLAICLQVTFMQTCTESSFQFDHHSFLGIFFSVLQIFGLTWSKLYMCYSFFSPRALPDLILQLFTLT